MLNRILIVGYGSIGERHLRIARKYLPSADIRVLTQRYSDDILKYANGHFKEVQDACNFSPQASIIANPAPFHIKIATSLVIVGSHILVEKPLAERVSECDHLLSVAENHNKVVQIGYNLRFDDSLVEFRRLVKSRVMGSIYCVSCEAGQYLPSWRPERDYRNTVSANREMGGGVLLELSHEIDYLRWIFGEIDWVSGYIDKQSVLEVDVEDIAHLMLRFRKDGCGYQTVGKLSLDFIRQDKVRVCTAICEKGSLRWDGITKRVEQWDLDRELWTIFFQSMQKRDDTYRLQFIDFLNCIQNKTAPKISGQDGVEVLKIVEAIRESSINSCARVYIGQ